MRPIKMSDAGRFVKWLNDKEVHKFLQAQNRNLTLKKEKIWIRKAVKDRINRHFAIETANREHIGAVSLENVDLKHHRATFGIFIGDKKYWNQGLGTDAAKTIINYGFAKLKLHRIELSVMSYNPRAIRVYKKLGFKLEGKKREHVFYKSRYRDSLNMAILDREWMNQEL